MFPLCQAHIYCILFNSLNNLRDRCHYDPCFTVEEIRPRVSDVSNIQIRICLLYSFYPWLLSWTDAQVRSKECKGRLWNSEENWSLAVILRGLRCWGREAGPGPYTIDTAQGCTTQEEAEDAMWARGRTPKLVLRGGEGSLWKPATGKVRCPICRNQLWQVSEVTQVRGAARNSGLWVGRMLSWAMGGQVSRGLVSSA